MRTSFVLAITLSLAACITTDGGKPRPDHSGPTRIGGDLTSCTLDDGGDGIWLATAKGNECVARCDETSRSASGLCPVPGDMWYGLPLNGQSVCYCYNPN